MWLHHHAADVGPKRNESELRVHRKPREVRPLAATTRLRLGIANSSRLMAVSRVQDLKKEHRRLLDARSDLLRPSSYSGRCSNSARPLRTCLERLHLMQRTAVLQDAWPDRSSSTRRGCGLARLGAAQRLRIDAKEGGERTQEPRAAGCGRRKAETRESNERPVKRRAKLDGGERRQQGTMAQTDEDAETAGETGGNAQHNEEKLGV